MANTNKAGVQFTAYIPPATLEALKASAKREHRSYNAQLVWFIEQGLEKEETMATLQEAVQAKKENKVVLADWTGRRVTINTFVQNEQTSEWSAQWSHSDYPNSRWDTVSEDQQFIIRGEYASYR